MVRPGFGLAEVIVSATLLAVAVLGLAASAMAGQRAILAAELRERAVRHAAALLDSLSFSGVEAAQDSSRIGPFELRWSAAAGAAALASVSATWSAAAPPETLRFVTRRVPILPVRRP